MEVDKLPALPLSNINNVDYFVISMPKCGSTSLYNALRRIHPNKVMGFHSDFTIRRLHPDSGETIKSLINKRNLISRPYYIFRPFREPVSRKISQYYEYGLSSGKDTNRIIKEVRRICLGDFSIFNPSARTEVNENIFHLSLSKSDWFDKELGYSHTIDFNENVIRYVLLKTDNLEKYLQELISPDFKLLIEHRTKDVNNYFKVKELIKFSDDELDEIYSNFCEYYYTEEQIDKFKERYIE